MKRQREVSVLIVVRLNASKPSNPSNPWSQVPFVALWYLFSIGLGLIHRVAPEPCALIGLAIGECTTVTYCYRLIYAYPVQYPGSEPVG